MARPPNYSFERQERDRAKAKKAADKANAKREAREAEQAKSQGSAPADQSGDS